MDTIILVKDKKSDVEFPVYGSTPERARQKLVDLQLSADEFDFIEVQNGPIFDAFIGLFEPKPYEPFDPAEFLHNMIKAARNIDTEFAHAEADNVLYDALEKANALAAPGIRVFKQMAKWYA